MRGKLSPTARIALLAVLAVAVGAAGAFAARRSGTVATYTGCLTTTSGSLNNLAAGSSPLRTCTSGQVQVQLSGGDITAVSAGTGLAGGADNGDATLALDPDYQLPQGCAENEFPQRARFIGWLCGSPLQFAQSKQSCPGGQAANGIDVHGALTCAPAAEPSRAFVARQTSSVDVNYFADTVLASLEVPAGSYVISAKADVSNRDRDPQDFSCKLSTGDLTAVRIDGVPDATGSGGAFFAAIPVEDGATFASNARITLTCATYLGEARHGVIIATKVDDVTEVLAG